MNCQKCNGAMFIDEWGGWFWTCPFCEYVGREATDAETEKQEQEMEEYYRQSRKDFNK